MHPVFLNTRLARLKVTGSGEGCRDVGEAGGDRERGSFEVLERTAEVADRAAARSGEDIGGVSR